VGHYLKVAKTSEIEDQCGKCVVAGGRAIALFNVGGEFFAIDDLCPHQEGPLSEGYVEGYEVECPWHAATFNLKTGAHSGPPAEADVKTYPVRVVGDDIEVEVEVEL